MIDAVLGLVVATGLAISLGGTLKAIRATPVLGADEDGYLSGQGLGPIKDLLSRQRNAWKFLLIGFLLQFLGAIGLASQPLWRPRTRDNPLRNARALDNNELSRVTGRGDVDYVGFFQGHLYNGSPCTLTRVFLTIEARSARDSLQWRRSFAQNVFIEPLSTDNIMFQVGETRSESSRWSIDSAMANCPQPQ